MAFHLTGIFSMLNLVPVLLLIPSPEPQIREIPDPEKPIGDPQLSLKASVVQDVENAICWINHYPLDSAIDFLYTYPLESEISGG